MAIAATLVTDGSSDVVLLRILEWLAVQVTPEPIQFSWADLRLFRTPPNTLAGRLDLAVRYYPCQLLLVHRDAENQGADLRYQEIATANTTGMPHVCVVPVRMQEAWLFHNEAALREAAGRPSGTNDLHLPNPNVWATIPDAKEVLHTALREASGAQGRRASRFRPGQAAHRLADLITDWSPLRQLTAFQRLEMDLRHSVGTLGLQVHPP
jgi:hypothetical protein